MKTRSAKEVMLCWNPGSDEVALAPWPDTRGLSNAYECTALACDDIEHMTAEQLKDVCFIETMHAIVADKCDSQAVHRALLGVTEYVAGCNDDMPGVAALLPKARL